MTAEDLGLIVSIVVNVALFIVLLAKIGDGT